MAAKNNGSKKTPRFAVRVASAPARAKTKAAGGKAAFYVTEPGLLALVSSQKPKVPGRVRQCAGFDEAKSAAVDSLVQAIEEAERQLIALKRAATYKEFTAARTAGWPA